MAFLDWDYETSYCSVSLDAATKYEGNASLRFTVTKDRVTAWAKATRKNYSVSQLRVVFRALRMNCDSGYLFHPGYGILSYRPYLDYGVWQRFRLSFWYDAGTNTRWGRVEREENGSWVKKENDTNFGTGSPASGSFYFYGQIYWITVPYNFHWLDAVEAYSAAL